MSRKVLNWFKSLFKKADLYKVNKKKVYRMYVESGYSPELANIYTEYFNWVPVHWGMVLRFNDDVYYSWWFFYILRPIALVLGLIAFVIGIFTCESIFFHTPMKNIKGNAIIFGIVMVVFLAFLALLILINHFVKGKTSQLSFDKILIKNNINDVETLDEYIDEMENILNRPHDDKRWFNINTYFWTFSVPILSMFLATTADKKLKATFASIFEVSLVAMLIIWFIRIIIGNDVPKMFRNERVKDNVFIGLLRSTRRRWKTEGKDNYNSPNNKSVNSDELTETLRSIDDKLSKVNKTSQKRTRRR
ncbi:hypothetical protein [Lactiplantibacillus modestisalitolerans]|uniref:Uncharacterized protein n=1 Tax=Lactiplantibacillus modestisalitolerans TaxID=1457219 RepID=A0ABV5WQW6_9LACO|nr:hypothetical protein [Lactiplantibacillus modestisalitolerans]